MRRASFGIAVVVLFTLTGCGGGEEQGARDGASASSAQSASKAIASERPSAYTRTAACSTSAFEVAFDQDEAVTVTSSGRELAFASYTDRGIAETCTVKAPTRSYASGLREEGVYRDAKLTCTGRGGIEIHVHPIWDGNTGGIAGSNLLVAVSSGKKPEVIVSAVLKNQEQASVASRIYFAPGYCELA